MTIARARLIENFGRNAADYDARANFQHTQTARVVDAAHMLVSAQANILDVGCGTGQFAEMSAATQPNWQITGVDIAEGMCKVARARCTTIQADAEALPLADASYDAVVSSLCLQWVAQLDTGMREIGRVLKPGGLAVLATLAQGTLSELHQAADVAALPLGLLAMRDVEEYKTAARKIGLEITMATSSCEIRHYATLRVLIDSMRDIGAGNNFVRSTQGMMGAKRWRAMAEAYELLRMPEGLPATWNHLFMILRKPL